MKNELNKISSTRQAVITAACIALCTVLPMAFHSIPQAGIIYCPMHLPVLLCGLVCSWQYGLTCGVIGTVLSSLVTGMPTAADLPSMCVELAVYALVCSVGMKLIYTKKAALDLYISLVASMLLGRVAAGLVKALIFARGSLTVAAWAATYFVSAIPALVLQLVLVPAIYFALEKANLIPSRYVDFEEDEDEF